jgi:membrane dipeptidase
VGDVTTPIRHGARAEVLGALAELHTSAVVVDGHNDLLMLCMRRPPSEQAAYFRRTWLPQLRAGGIDVQVLPVYIDDEFRPEGALRRTLKMIEAAWRIARGNDDVVSICLTGAEIDAALARGKIALVLALEGSEAVGTDVDLFETLHRVGIRIASFTHWGRTQLADGSAEEGAGSRLTRAGVAAVAVCEEVGIMLDVSHLSAAGTDHLLEVARRPVIATHSSAYAVLEHHRNLTDERLRGTAESGGVVGINFFAGFIDPHERTVARLADHIDHVAQTVGVDHVGLGSDFIDELFRETMPMAQEIVIEGLNARELIVGLEGPAGMPLVTAELVRRGWSEVQVRAALGESFLTLFRTDLGVTLADRRQPLSSAEVGLQN